jgi:hypothetical protein
LLRVTHNTIHLVLSCALLLLAACGGVEPEEDLQGGTEGELERETQHVRRACYPDGLRMRVEKRTPLRKRPTHSSPRLRWVPKGAIVRLADPDRNGVSCAHKKSPDQPHYFFLVNHKGKRGWIVRYDMIFLPHAAYSKKCHICGNCAIYAQCRAGCRPWGGRSAPICWGMWTLADKLRAANRANNPFPGCIAVTRPNHLAYVYRVVGTTIWISESNWARSCPSVRKGSKQSLKILGFWCPR